MNINEIDYKIKNASIKLAKPYKRIVIDDSCRVGSNHIIHLINQNNDVISSNYTITREGVIYNNIPYGYFTNLFNNKELNETSITISLENANYLIYENKKYFNWINELVDKNNVGMRLFNGFKFWEKYPIVQIKALAELIIYLLDITKIENKIIGDNIFDKNLNNFNGVVCKGNLIPDNYEVNPLFDFNLLKSLIIINK